jgi:hypothetical protein
MTAVAIVYHSAGGGTRMLAGADGIAPDRC